MIHSLRDSIHERFRRLKANEEGSTTIEFVLWFPIMVFVLILAAQGAILFMVQANYGHAARDTARLVARHALTPDEAKDRLLNGNVLGGSKANASVVIDGGMVAVSISAKATDLSSFNVFGLAENIEIAAQIIHEMEPM